MALAAFLLLVVFSVSEQVLGREVVGSRTFVQAKGNHKRSAAVLADNSKKRIMDSCRSPKLMIEKNCTSTALDDDKRAVPTGPNPLHNR